MTRKPKRDGEFDEFYKIAARLHELKKQAHALGMFTDDRDLLRCPQCGLKEDVTGEGFLCTYRDDAIGVDTGLRFEEMFGVPVDRGALYWHGSHERREIDFTVEIKRQLEETVAAVADILEKRILPLPINNQRCPECSLKNICLPAVVADKGRSRKAARELFAI